MKKKNLLISGGTGFLGYHLSKAAIKQGLKVTSISQNYPKKKRKIKNVNYLICDISKKKDLNKISKKKFDYVVNLAGYVDHSNNRKVFNSHFLGCKYLVESLLKTPPRSFVQIGSSMEYGKLKSPQKESSFCNPISNYGKAKLASTLYIKKQFLKSGFPATILRLYQVYGENQDVNRFLPIIIKNCIANKRFPCSDGNQFRDFLHVSDAVRAILKSLKNKNSIGHVINIGSGKCMNLRKIIELIKKQTKGGKPDYGKIKLRPEEIKKVFPDVKKSKKILNWKSNIKFDNGLKRTINFYKEKNK